jgi:hypothetical protein
MNPDEDLEAMARAILRDTIERSGWYPALRGEERRRLIDRDVEQHWPLMVEAARKKRELVEIYVDEIETDSAIAHRRLR